MSLSEILLPEFDAEMATTRRVLERVPDDKPDWKPHPKSFSMAHLAQLVAKLPGWVLMMCSRTEIDIAPTDGPKGPGYTNEKVATLLAEFDQNVVQARAALEKITDADFDVPWTLKAGGREVMKDSRYQMMRSTVFNHIVHHRAQLGVYLRMVDVKVPIMYGPTADEKM